MHRICGTTDPGQLLASTAFLFILGLKRMSSPVTARSGIVWAGVGMLVATLVTFFYPGMSNFGADAGRIVVGGALAWVSGKRVAMTDMPQMIALYNGMGGGAAAAIAAVELYRGGERRASLTASLAVLGGIIGAVSFSGSLIAFAQAAGPHHQVAALPRPAVPQPAVPGGERWCSARWSCPRTNASPAGAVTGFFGLRSILGVAMTLPIGGADMPVVISLYNALTGLAVAFEGFVLDNAAMIIAGTVVGSAGTLLTQLMAQGHEPLARQRAVLRLRRHRRRLPPATVTRQPEADRGRAMPG